MRRRVIAALGLSVGCFNPASDMVGQTEGSTASGSTTSTTADSAPTSGTTTNSTTAGSSSSAATSTTSDTEDSGPGSTGGTGPGSDCEPTNPARRPGCGDGDVFAGDICFPADGTNVAFADEALFALGVGDLDGDGAHDVVAVSEAPSVYPGLNDGTGSFVAGPEFVIEGGEGAGAVALGDLDGDGDDDVALTLQDEGRLVLLRSDGAGVFASVYSDTIVPAGPGAGTYDVDLGDLDGDGTRDVAVAAGAAVYVILTDGALVADTIDPISVPSLQALRSVVIADVEPDGDLDLVGSYAEVVAVHANNGDASFAAPQSTVVDNGGTEGSSELEVADVTADGRPDVIVAVGNAVHVLEGDGAGGFAEDPSPLIVSQLSYVEVGDTNADCLPDLIIGATPAGVLDLFVYANPGDGAFENSVEFGFSGGATAFEVGELNADGLPDVVGVSIVGALDVSLSDP